MFCFQESRDAVEVAFTDRHGDVRGGPAASLNLAEPKPDAPDLPAAVAMLEQNIDVVAGAMARGPAPTVVRMHQVHRADVQTVDHAWLERVPARSQARTPVVDGLVTDLPGVVLLVRAADCVPVLLADPARGVVGAAHAGRLGLVAGVVPATVERMLALGAERLTAWVGPHVCGRCYEVPAAMREQVAAAAPAAFAETSWGTPAVDVGAGVRAQLRAAEVEIVDASRCTVENDDLYSYRRQGAGSGRLGGLVWMRP